MRPCIVFPYLVVEGEKKVAPSPSAVYNPSMSPSGAVTNSLLSRITAEPGKCGGRPCIRGTRLRVKDVLELLGAGASYEEVLADYPFLERDDILAAITYAARQADHTVLQSA